MKRKKKIRDKFSPDLYSNDITRSYCPVYVTETYGARTRISSCLAVALVNRPMYYAHCFSVLKLSEQSQKTLRSRLDMAQEPVLGQEKTTLFPPHIVVCHNTRYREGSLTGLIRILGFGKFGELATFSLEDTSKGLLQETKLKKEDFGPADVFASFGQTKVVGVLRIYAPTTPEKRLTRMPTRLVFPSKDLGLDIRQIETSARDRYQIG